MKKINAILIAVIAASLILVAGCYDGGVTQPEVIGYDGYVTMGWACFEAGDYVGAMEAFQNALDMDVAKPDAYLGAGWCSILLPDYWVIGDQYDYMAVQHDDGTWPIELLSGSMTQDKDWTVFDCTVPALTANDRMVIESFGDSLLVVEGDTLIPSFSVSAGDTTWHLAVTNVEIGDWLYDEYSNMRFQYTFEIDNPNVTAMFIVVNGFSSQDCAVDSLVNGTAATTVYISVPYFRVEAGENYRTWCMNDNDMGYEYATYQNAGGQTAFATDAVAAYGLLQDARGENADVLSGVATLIGLADEGEYSFSHYAGITSLKMKGMAAAMAYRNLYFRPALGICRSEGFGLDIQMSDPDFLVELMQAIEMMLQ